MCEQAKQPDNGIIRGRMDGRRCGRIEEIYRESNQDVT